MALTAHLPRRPLAFLPTPLHPLPRLSSQLSGPRIWIKRDDQTGLAGGGNKTRKLEFLIADALAQGADTVLTTGAAQSNHCRQTAAAAAQAGLACHLVLSGTPPAHVTGNLLLDRLLGARLHWTTRENRLPRLAALTNELRAAGRHPYPITYGGSDAVGASGYALAVEELRAQVQALGLKLDAIVFAASSGGTQAGLTAGAWALGWDVSILGISVDEQAADLQAKVAELATATAAHLRRPHVFAADEIRVNADYLGRGYGVMGDLEREAITLLARTEAVLLDPVYTGRAFGGLLDMIRRGAFDPGQNVLFWHTGGAPALYAYADELL
ncbi:MAG: D-cysteine desulfhydrase family protein [Chloroflexi bacterium HGW-Chloroflexi-1]|nr:MAG: D-cysteine desulfhydrase family protein [Chloroflexi bacterium HGW-Chloroflexi-1]